MPREFHIDKLSDEFGQYTLVGGWSSNRGRLDFASA
jgi:hypothetical protein